MEKMLHKAKVSANEEKAIKTALERLDKAQIIAVHAKYPNDWSREDYVTSLNGMELDKLIRSLYIGYEVEMTPEEKVREYVEKLKMKHYQATGSMNCAESSAGHELRGCMKTLDIIGIKISGVNAE